MLLTVLSLTLCCSGVRGACQEDETAEFVPSCRGTIFAASHIFPSEWGVLHDSWDFTNLLGQSIAKYREVDVDGVGDSRVSGPTSVMCILPCMLLYLYTVYWFVTNLVWLMYSVAQWTARGGVCQQELRVCSNFLSAAQRDQQNNWVFSSYIRFPNVPGVDSVQEVFFNISYRFFECQQRPDCTRSYVTAYKYDVDTPVAENIQTDPSRYSPLRGTVEQSRIEQPQQLEFGDINRLFSIARPSNNGFYLAFRDQGTCGQVRRVIVYYERTLRYNGILLTCPTVPYPLEGSATTTQGTCCCGENAASNGSHTIVCSANRTCVEHMSGVCGCVPRYVFNMETQACIGEGLVCTVW